MGVESPREKGKRKAGYRKLGKGSQNWQEMKVAKEVCGRTVCSYATKAGLITEETRAEACVSVSGDFIHTGLAN